MSEAANLVAAFVVGFVAGSVGYTAAISNSHWVGFLVMAVICLAFWIGRLIGWVENLDG